jgi:hypothetical protein
MKLLNHLKKGILFVVLVESVTKTDIHGETTNGKTMM